MSDEPKFSGKQLVVLLSKDTLLAICRAHSDQFQSRLDSGCAHVNVSECTGYQGLWTHGYNCVKTGRELPPKVVDEIVDYLASGETNHLTPEEAVFVTKYMEDWANEEDA